MTTTPDGYVPPFEQIGRAIVLFGVVDMAMRLLVAAIESPADLDVALRRASQDQMGAVIARAGRAIEEGRVPVMAERVREMVEEVSFLNEQRHRLVHGVHVSDSPLRLREVISRGVLFDEGDLSLDEETLVGLNKIMVGAALDLQEVAKVVRAAGLRQAGLDLPGT